MIIEHIGIAVKSLEEAAKTYEDLLGLAVEGFEDVADQGVRVAMLPIGESRIELLEPVTTESPIQKFLTKSGPGIHHIAIKVDNIDESLKRMQAAGARLIDESPRPGANNTRTAFVHPKSLNGVLLELVEHDK